MMKRQACTRGSRPVMQIQGCTPLLRVQKHSALFGNLLDHAREERQVGGDPQ